MDERQRRAENARQARQQDAQKRRPGGSAKRTGNVRPQGNRGPGGHRSRKSSRARRRRRNFIIRILLFILLLILVAGGIVIWKRYGSSKEKVDLKQYYGIQSDDDLALVVNYQQAYTKDGQQNDGDSASIDEGTPGGKMIDGVPYVEYSVVRDDINERFYWDSNENVLLYTLPTGSVSVSVGSKEYTDIKDKKSEDYVILKTEGKTAYIALEFIKQYTDMDYKVYDNPNRAVIVSKFGDTKSATVKSDTQVRYQGGVKSPILEEVKKSDKVTVLQDENDWQRICTSDGFIGYIKTSSLKNIQTETADRNFKEPEYTNISVDKTINMAWHNVENDTANGYVLETIAGTKGLTTIAPTWFNVADTSGNITSLASGDYVNYAHQSNLDVWGVLRDFHGGINSYDETYQLLSYTSKRENLINQVIAAALQSGLDGINLDFELISQECGEHYIQFIRELSVKCRQNGLVLSIDNYVPMSYNEYYDLKEQGIVADYVIIMGYDEYTEGSYEAGPVASYDYVKSGIENALKEVPNTKLVNAVPFYSRLWHEVPKTEAELSEEEGTEAAQYPNNVTSEALGMDEAAQIVQTTGATAAWDDKTKQNYAEWASEDGGTYKIWIEDNQSLEEKLKLIKSNKLAGVAEWKLGMENSSVWDLILQYVN